MNIAPKLPQLWDQHACPTLEPSASLDAILDYRGNARVTVGLNVGYAPQNNVDSIELIHTFSRKIQSMQGVSLCKTLAAVDRAHVRGDVAVFFDLEDSSPLGGDVEALARFADLGVRSILPTYNNSNSAGSGCLDTLDEGLTDFGRRIVDSANSYGVTVDASHCSIQSGLELCKRSTTPVIYSHTAMRSVWESPRNVTDEQARACADAGGVIGICGVGIFLGENEATVAAMVRHIEYAMELVGPQHVGIGSDYSFDQDAVNEELRINAHLFPPEFSRYGAVDMVPPAQTLSIASALRDRGHTEADIAAIIGGNFRRVAEQVWTAA